MFCVPKYNGIKQGFIQLTPKILTTKTSGNQSVIWLKSYTNASGPILHFLCKIGNFFFFLNLNLENGGVFFFSPPSPVTLYYVWKVMSRYRKGDEELHCMYSSNSVMAQGYASNHKEETTDWNLTRYKNSLNCCELCISKLFTS